jgi:hypothetical protein
MENKKVCPYCGNSGQIKFISANRKSIAVDKYNKPLVEYSYYTCPCVNNKVISETYNKLSGTPDVTLAEAIYAGKFAGFRNLVIHGSEEKFLFLVKATMLLHANYHRTFEILNGIELVQKYYVEQRPGTFRSLSDLEAKDLLIFLFDAAPENKVQNTTVFEVIKNRLRMNSLEKRLKKEEVYRPTWVYTTSQESITKSKEYSSDAGQLLKTHFTWLNLEDYDTPFKAAGPESLQKRSAAQDITGDI